MIWAFKEKLDISFLILIDLVISLKLHILRFIYFGNEFQHDVSSLPETIQVISNGPSSTQHQDQIDVFLPTIFMNFGFEHEKFSECESAYLVVVDKKLATGEWQISMLMRAMERNPKVKIFLGGKLLSSPELRAFAYKNKNVFFFFNDLSTFTNKRPIKPLGNITIGGGATEASIVLAVQLGAKIVKIFGFDGNNVLLGILGQKTHFYGHDPIKNWSSAQFCARELRFLSYFLDKNVNLAEIIRHAGVRVINMSSTSIMTMYGRQDDEI